MSQEIDPDFKFQQNSAKIMFYTFDENIANSDVVYCCLLERITLQCCCE